MLYYTYLHKYTQAPTLFPILFAALTSRALKSLAQWRIEHGAPRVGHLDQLVGSTSITATFITQLKLRALNLLAIALVLTWALSP
jgi:hypothetical protein